MRPGHLESSSTSRVVLAVGTSLIAAFWLFAGLPTVWAIAGMSALGGTWAWVASRSFGTSRPDHGAAREALPEASGIDWPGITEGIPDASIVVDAASKVLAANAQARETLAVRTGLPLSAAVRTPELLAAVERAMATGAAQSAEVRLAVPVERTLSALMTPVTGADGETRLLIVLRDRTEAESLAQMRADFVANASHELRTPLASLKGFVETLQGAAKDDPVARERFLGIMQAEAARMSRLIEDLLSLSRVEMREHVAPREVVDLTQVADDITKALEPLATQQKRTLTVSASERPAQVIGDRDELGQVVQNLMQNAIKYGREGGHVRVTIKREDLRMALVVADDGIGIAPEHLPRLTERFYRVSAKESRERGGTGLGLAIVKHIVNRHRGELRVDSQPGKGSTFTVLLPRAEG